MNRDPESCDHAGHAHVGLPPATAEAVVRAAAIFRAAGDTSRLRLLLLLEAGERCVSELADAESTKLSTLSQQLRVLLAERLVKRRRDGKHVFYSLADDHIGELIRSSLAHAREHATAPTDRTEGT